MSAQLNSSDGDKDLVYRLQHDLSGPLVTARGFLDELIEVRGEIAQWLDANRESLSASGADAMQQLLDDELDECVTYLGKTLMQLDDRILTISKEFSDSKAANDQ